jgi:hypothetical protein
MTKGQRAMIAAKVNSLKIKEFGDQKRIAEQAKVNTGYVSQAATVLQYAPDLVDAVMEGAPLNAAYATAQKRKADAESKSRRLKRVRAESTDLADQITGEKLTLGFDIRRVWKNNAHVDFRSSWSGRSLKNAVVNFDA